jgi:SAM-dependent methyltransferase
MAFETRKFEDRAFNEDPDFWDDVFTGSGLDVGCGPCPLVWANAQVTPFDTPQGDGNNIASYFKEGSFDFVFSSQFLEHTHDPVDVMRQMIKLVKKGGWVIALVPSELYEGNILPSKYNPDHKATFSAISRTAPHKRRHIYLPDLSDLLKPHRVDCSLEHTNYDFMVGTTRDQSWKLEDGVECWWELRIQKTL